MPDKPDLATRYQDLLKQYLALEQYLQTRETEVEQLREGLETAQHTLEAMNANSTAATSQSAAPAPTSVSGNSTQDVAGASVPVGLIEWVDTVFIKLVERETGMTTRWCRRWPEHPEAVLRLTALWEDRTNIVDPESKTDLSSWLRWSVDSHMPKLMDQAGPFRECDDNSHVPAIHLPTTTATETKAADAEGTAK